MTGFDPAAHRHLPVLLAALCLSMLPATPARADARFSQQPAGSTLPSSSSCRATVLSGSDAKEIRPANRAANNQATGWISVRVAGASAAWNTRYAARIKGDLAKPAARDTATDEVLDWAACKWGHDSHIARAMAMLESWWRQGHRGDRTYDWATCRKIGKAAPCYASYSLLQVRGTVHPGSYPGIQGSTPFAADYAMAFLHACYNGVFGWLGGGYRAGDIWGCVEMYNSGRWYDRQAQEYISRVKNHYNNKTWDT